MPSRTIRLFVSSTFADFRAERDILHRKVFPRIAALCEESGFAFEPVDLRWGVSDEAVRTGRTVAICLDEIDRCRQVSPGVNFFFLVGNRYGWRPLPEAVPLAVFERLIAVIAEDSPDTASRLATAYRRDDNTVPPTLRLNVPPDALGSAVVAALSRAAERAGFGDCLWSGASLTEMEIAHALFANRADDSDTVRPVGMIRHLRGLPAGVSDYVDGTADGRTRDDEATRRAERLRERLLALPGDHIRQYTLDLDRVPAAFEELASALLTDVVVRAMRERETTVSAPAPQNRIPPCIGRRQEERDLSERLATATNFPILVTGPSGIGKSVFMHRMAEAMRQRHPSWTVIDHFVGVSAASAAPDAVLRDLCERIAAVSGTPLTASDLAATRLTTTFRDRLATASAERPLLVIVDGLDQILSVDPGHRYGWLDHDSPPEVRILISATPDAVPARLPRSPRWTLAALAADEAGELLDFWLAGAGRRLTDAQRRRLLDVYAPVGLPLYLKLLFEQARDWRSWMPPPSALPVSARDAIATLFEHLAQAERHGPELVTWSLAYLCAARSGLSRREMMDLLSANAAVRADLEKRATRAPAFDALPDVVWSRLRFDLAPYLVERAAEGTVLMGFFHGAMATVAQDLFAAADRRAIGCGHLADYFTRQPCFQGSGVANRRKTAELPYQLFHAGRVDPLRATLSDPPFLDAKCQSGSVLDLVADYGFLPDTDPLRRVGRSLQMSADVLSEHPDQLASQVMGRLLDADEPEIARLMGRIGAVKPKPALRPRDRFLLPPERGLFSTFQAGDQVNALAIRPDGTLVASVEYGQHGGPVKLWKPETGEVVSHFNCGISGPVAIRIGNGPAVLVLDKDNASPPRTIGAVWDAVARRKIREIHEDLAANAILSADGAWVLSRRPGHPALDIWSAGTDGPKDAMARQDSPIIAFREAGGIVAASAADGTVRLWDLDSRQEVGRYRVPVDPSGGFHVITMLADDRIILRQAHGKSAMSVFDVRQECLLGKPALDGPAVTGGILTAVDGRLLLAARADREIHLWDAVTGERLATLQGHSDEVRSIAAHPTEPLLLSGSNDETVRFWDLRQAVREGQREDATGWVNAVAAGLDGVAVTIGQDKAIRVWNLTDRTSRVVARINDRADTACVIPRTPVCVVGDQRGRLSGWDTHSGTPVFTIEAHARPIRCVHVSADGVFAATSAWDSSIKVWRVDALMAGGAAELLRLEDDSPLDILRFTVDGTRLVWPWDATHLRVTDALTGERLRDIDGFPPMTLTESDGRGGTRQRVRKPTNDEECWIHALALTPDGRHAVANSWDNSLAVWDLETGSLVWTLVGHTKWVTAIDVTPDGKFAVSASKDRTVRLWSLTEGTLVDTITSDGYILCCAALASGDILAGDAVGVLRFFALDR